MNLCFSLILIFMVIYYSINVFSIHLTNCISIITISAYWVKSFPSPQTSVQMISSRFLLMSIRTPIGLFWNPFTIFLVGCLKCNCFLCKILHEKQKLLMDLIWRNNFNYKEYLNKNVWRCKRSSYQRQYCYSIILKLKVNHIKIFNFKN